MINMHDGTRRGIGIMVEDKYLGTVALKLELELELELETAIVIT